MNASPLALLLEDEPLIAMDVEDTLRDVGFSVVTFGRCAPAEDWLATHRPDIAILDMTLPDGPCVEVARRLRDAGIPFIVHSGAPESPHSRDTVFEAGHWIGKPSLARELAQTARALVQQPVVP